MAVMFEGFPRTLQRSALRPGRWFVAAEGPRPVLCLATDVVDGGEALAVAFTVPDVEQIEVAPIPVSVLLEPFGTIEDDVVFSPGQAEGLPMLVAPQRRAFRHGALLRLTSGDLGVGLVTKASETVVAVSLASGAASAGFDLVFDRWALALRRGGNETRIGYHKPRHLYAERRRS